MSVTHSTVTHPSVGDVILHTENPQATVKAQLVSKAVEGLLDNKQVVYLNTKINPIVTRRDELRVQLFSDLVNGMIKMQSSKSISDLKWRNINHSDIEPIDIELNNVDVVIVDNVIDYNIIVRKLGELAVRTNTIIHAGIELGESPLDE